jgi:hypothetical protein
MKSLLLILLAASACCSDLAAQKKKKDKWKTDPYTKNDPKKMAAAGYLNYGPFRFGDIAGAPVQSTDIDKALPYVNIIWVETEHFRIGTQLPPWSVPTEMVTRKKIRAELTELKKKLPTIKPKTRKLDSWLRTHLIAFRLERLYSETLDLFGVTDDQFPTDPSKVIAGPGKVYMGFGPYMGMKDKFLLLLFDKGATHYKYMEKFLGLPRDKPQRWHFTNSSSILFAASQQSDDFPLKHDTALHCSLAFNISQNLFDGFRYYGYETPIWIREGFGHWNCRRVSGDWPNFDSSEGSSADVRMVKKWKPYAKALINKPKKYAPFAEAAKWRDFGKMKFNDHVMAFSRIDFLLSFGKTKWKEFLFSVKGRVTKDWHPDQSDLIGATREGLKKAYKLTFLNFDERWAKWVKSTYPSK